MELDVLRRYAMTSKKEANHEKNLRISASRQRSLHDQERFVAPTIMHDISAPDETEQMLRNNAHPDWHLKKFRTLRLQQREIQRQGEVLGDADFARAEQDRNIKMAEREIRCENFRTSSKRKSLQVDVERFRFERLQKYEVAGIEEQRLQNEAHEQIEKGGRVVVFVWTLSSL